MRQARAQSFVRPEQQRFHRRFRTAQHLGDLRILHLFVLVHQHRGPLLFRQCRNRAPDFIQLGLRTPSTAPPTAGGPKPAGPAGSPESSSNLSCTLVLPVTERVQSQMRRDAKHPRGKLGSRLIRTSRTIHPQKHLLRQFLRNRVILHHPVEEVYNGRAMLFEQNTQSSHHLRL